MIYIIASRFWPKQASLFRKNQTAKKYLITRANMSRVKNEGVMMSYKEVTAKFLSLVCLLVEPSTPIAKPKGSIEAYI